MRRSLVASPRTCIHDVRKRKITGTGGKDKTAVIGIRKRGGDLKATVIPDRKRRTLHKMVGEQVEEGASVYTDALGSYAGLNRDYDHGVVDHATRYVIGRVHVNSVENFWTLLKRGLKGTYVQVAPEDICSGMSMNGCSRITSGT